MHGPLIQSGPTRVGCNTLSLVSLLYLGAVIMPPSRAQETINRTLTISNNTTTLMTSIPTDPAPPELFPAANGPNHQPVHDGTVFNYYFLFLAAFGVLVAAALWWVHQKRKQRKQQLRLRGQHALARDLEGWAGTRRFMHGRYSRYQASARTIRAEGSDERGEAPPPYQPKYDATVRAVHDPGNEVTIPLWALTREGSDRRRPPQYSHTASTRL